MVNGTIIAIAISNARDRLRRQDYFADARGLSVREIQGHLEEMDGTEVSPSLISSVTDAVSDEVKRWQGRPLDPLYPIL